MGKTHVINSLGCSVVLPHAPYCRGRVGQPEGNRRNGTKVTLAGRVDFCAAALTPEVDRITTGPKRTVARVRTT